MFLTPLRQLVILLPAAYLLGRWFGIRSVWYAFPAAEAAACAFSAWVYRRKGAGIPDKPAGNGKLPDRWTKTGFFTAV